MDQSRPTTVTFPVGSLTVIAGSMFSGKTEEMIRRVRRAVYARKHVQIFKHALDTRSEPEEIHSHGGASITAVPVSSGEDLLEWIEAGTDLVAVEEAQFFDGSVVDALQGLANRGVEVIASGLDLDFRGRPFGPMPALLAVADEVVKLRAICTICGRDASRTQRLVDGEPAPPSAPTILVGASECYEARCRHHHETG